MTAYLVRRVLLIPPTLLALALLIFTLTALAPGDAAEEYARINSRSGEATSADIAAARVQLGLDQPFIVRFGRWVAAAVHGDLGRSFTRQTAVADEIRERFGATAELAATALAITIVAAVPLGTVAAMLHGTWIDHGLRALSLLAASVPSFFLAYILIIVFATRLHLFPVAGREDVSSLVLPALALAAGSTATVSRLLRASLLEVLGEDYIRTARAKGLPWVRVAVRHALPNAAIPVVTVIGALLGSLLAGSVIVELIFAWPGVGRLLAESVAQRDYPTIEGLVVVAGGLFLLLNLVVDVSYTWLDPRVRLGERR